MWSLTRCGIDSHGLESVPCTSLRTNQTWLSMDKSKVYIASSLDDAMAMCACLPEVRVCHIGGADALAEAFSRDLVAKVS